MTAKKEFRVCWVIDVDADDAVEAARVAEWIMQDPDSTARCFWVSKLANAGKDSWGMEVDLEAIRSGRRSA